MRYSESQITSEFLDQPIFAGTPTKLFICSTPRSGSYLLCRYMINAGLGVPHEYFNPIIMREIAARLGLGAAAAGLQWRPRNRLDRLSFRNRARVAEEDFLRRYLAVLIPRRCQRGVFAAKIHTGHFRKVLDNPTGHDLFAGSQFVHLYRENLLRQAVSAQFAHLTGRWSIDNTVSTTPAEHPDFYDSAMLDRILRDLAQDNMEWRLFFARNGLAPLSISYESLCRDPPGCVATIAQLLGLDPATLRQGYEEARDPVESSVGLPDKAEAGRRYVAAFRTLRGTAADAAKRPAGAMLAAPREAGA